MTPIERYIKWRNRPKGWIFESEFPQASFPGDYLLTMDGDLIRETYREDAVRDYRPNFVDWVTELSDGSWVLHREDGPARILAQTEISGTYFDDNQAPVIGAGWAYWFIQGIEVPPFAAGMAPLIELSVTDL